MARRLFIGLNTLIMLYVLSPMLITIPASFSDAEIIVAIPERLSLRWYRNFLSNRELVDALLLSLRLAAAATVVSLLVAMPASLALVRYRFPGRDGVKAGLMSPMIIPALILGLSLLISTPISDYAGLSCRF